MKKNRQPLWLWGVILIVGGIAAGLFLGPATGATEFEQGEAFGQGLAMIGFIVIGLVLIVVDVARGRKGR